MYEPQSTHTKLALKTLKHIVENIDLKEIKNAEVPLELTEQLACFVSIHMNDGRLRGCIGTIEPREKNLYFEIISNTGSAATRDSRFEPLKKNELEFIELSVDVLSKPYLVDNFDELDPKKLGVIVTDDHYSRGVLLPDIEGIDTVEKQISIAKRKAGLEKMDDSQLKIYAFTSTRYF